MGLLLGDVYFAKDGTSTVRIWAVMPQIRTDRRKDRVEASPEQMARCAAVAERFSEESQTLTRVIGWYHSHPHITVLPSHVDVRTQASYQMLDRNFVGLIISAFNEDPITLSQSIEVTAFQSVPLQDTGLPALAASDMEQAMAASVADARNAGEWERKEVPLSIVASIGEPEQTLTDISGLLVVLLEEEKEAYEAAMVEACDADGCIDPLTAMHFSTTFQQHITTLIEIVLGPCLHTMRSCVKQSDLQRRQLADLEALLQEALKFQARVVSDPSDSPVSSSLQELSSVTDSPVEAVPGSMAAPEELAAEMVSRSAMAFDSGKASRAAASATAEEITTRMESVGLSAVDVGDHRPRRVVDTHRADVRAGDRAAPDSSEHHPWQRQQPHQRQQPMEQPTKPSVWPLDQSGGRQPSQRDPFADLGGLSTLDDYGRLRRQGSPQ